MTMVEAPGAFASSPKPLLPAPLPFILPSILLTAFPGRSELSNQVLNQFLAGQIAPDRHEFGEIRMTRADISQWLQKLRTAKQPQERGVAVSNLQNCAWVLLDTPPTVPVALEILNQWGYQIYVSYITIVYEY